MRLRAVASELSQRRQPSLVLVGLAPARGDIDRRRLVARRIGVRILHLGELALDVLKLRGQRRIAFREGPAELRNGGGAAHLSGSLLGRHPLDVARLGRDLCLEPCLVEAQCRQLLALLIEGAAQRLLRLRAARDLGREPDRPRFRRP